VTKPGSSDPVEPTAGKASEPDAPAEEAAPAEPVAEPVEVTEPAKAPEAKAPKAKPADDEPLMTDLEKAPPVPRDQAARAQAKRRFEEPAPRTLRFSFYFFTAAGLIWVANAIQYLVFKQEIIDQQVELNQNPDITPQQYADALTQIFWIMLVAAVTFTVFLGLFGHKATEGKRRARTLVTTFAVILLLFHIMFNLTQLGLLSALLALVALSLLWSKSSRAYFPPRDVR
jgi:hypothetical protein